MTDLNKKLLDKISTLIEELSHENADSSIVKLKSLLDQIQFDTEVFEKLEEIFSYDPEITNRLKLYLLGNDTYFEGIASYLKQSIGIMDKINDNNPTPQEVTKVQKSVETLPNGDKATVLTQVTTKINPELGQEVLRISSDTETSPSEEVLKESEKVVEVTTQDNFSDEPKIYPIVDLSKDTESPFRSQVDDICNVLGCMPVENASMVLAKIGSETRPEVSDALFSEIFSDTNEQCAQFSKNAVVYGTELNKAVEIINAQFSEEGIETNFSEVEQELYNRYVNNFSYMENMSQYNVNFSEEEINFAQNFSEEELISLLNYSDQELLDSGVPMETVEILSSIRDKVSCPVQECEDEANKEELNKNLNFARDFIAKANYVNRLANFGWANSLASKASKINAGRVYAASDAAKVSQKGVNKMTEMAKTAAYQMKHQNLTDDVAKAYKDEVVKYAGKSDPESQDKLKKALDRLNDFNKRRAVFKTQEIAAKKYLEKAAPYLEAQRIAEEAVAASGKSRAITAGVAGAGALGTGGALLLANRPDSGDVDYYNYSEVVPSQVVPQALVEAPLMPADAAKVVNYLSDKICDAGLNKEDASKVLVEVEDKVSPEVAEAVQADVLKDIDARFSEVVENLVITPSEAEAADQVIDQAIVDLAKEKAGEIKPQSFSAYGVSSFNKYYANFSYGEEVLDAVEKLNTPDEKDIQEKVKEKVDEAEAGKVSEANITSDVEDVVKSSSETKEIILPIEKTDLPTTEVPPFAPANKTDEPAPKAEELSKADAVSNFSAVSSGSRVNSNYADTLRKSLGF